MASRTQRAATTHGRSEVHERPDVMRAVAREKKRFGERVRQLRAAKEWSREVAAEKIGVHAVHIARIELGNANVTLTTVVAIARAFGVETKALFGDE